MAKREIRVGEALRDLRSGMNDTALMHKYKLTARGLQSLFTKLMAAGVVSRTELEERMPGFLTTAHIAMELQEPGMEANWKLIKRKREDLEAQPIKASEALADVRSGATDSDLMAKFRLSSKGLQDLFDQLADAGLISREELDLRTPSADSTVDVREIVQGLDIDELMGEDAPLRREGPPCCPTCGAPVEKDGSSCQTCGAVLPSLISGEAFDPSAAFQTSGRYVVVPIPIKDAQNPQVVGTIRDITETAVGTAGILAGVGASITFVVDPDPNLGIEPFSFDSKCRWISEGPDGNYARFEIMSITEKDLVELKNLIRVLTFGL
jgi:hypothetical protein